MSTLHDIVNRALSGSEASLKLASAADTAPTSGSLDFLDAELPKIASDDSPFPHAESKPKKKDKDDEEEQDKKASQIISDADFAMKLASALELGANIVSTKLASHGTSPLNAPGPAVSMGQHQGPPAAPKATSKVTDRITGPSTQGPNGLPTTKADFTSPNDHSGRAKNHPGKTASWTQDPKAAAAVLRAKVAQADMLIEMGQVEAAQSILDEVRSKVAQDPSSPQPEMGSTTANPGKLDTSEGTSSHIPDNAGAIALTKAQARDAALRTVSGLISEPPKKDPAVGAHMLSSNGQKISSDATAPKPAVKTAGLDVTAGRALLSRLVKTASDPNASEASRAKAASALEAIKARITPTADSLLT
jgi:hypothetical protein